MPTYVIEGKRVKADAALSEAEIDEIAASIKGAAPAAAAPAPAPAAAPQAAPSTLDVAMAAPLRGLAGVGDVLVNTPANIVNLGLAGAGRAMGAMGVPAGYLPGTVPTPPMVTQGLQAIGALPPEYQNLSSGQRVLQTGLAAGGAALAGGPQGAVRNMLLSGVGGAAGQTVEEATGSPLAGAATGAVVPGGLGGAFAARQQRLAQAAAQNAVRDQTLREARELGLIATPGSVNVSLAKRTMEGIAGKSPLQQLASVKNQERVNTAARRAVGLPDDAPLTSETMQKVRNEAYQAGYEPIKNIGRVPTDAQFGQQLDDVLTSYTGGAASFPGAVPESVTKLIGTFRVGDFASGDALKVIRTLRSQATANFRKGDNDTAKAQRAISDALEDQIERHLAANPTVNSAQMLENFRAARTRMAISHSVEDAIIEGAGAVNPRRFAADLQSGKYLSGDLRKLAAFANSPQFQGVMQFPIGTPAVSPFISDLYRTAPFSGAAGAGVGGPMGALAAGAVGLAMPAAARRYLMSDFMQNRLIPNYNPRTNALAAGPEAAIGALLEQAASQNQLAP